MPGQMPQCSTGFLNRYNVLYVTINKNRVCRKEGVRKVFEQGVGLKAKPSAGVCARTYVGGGAWSEISIQTSFLTF